MNPCEKNDCENLIAKPCERCMYCKPPPPPSAQAGPVAAPAYSSWSWSRRMPQLGTCFACDSRLSVCVLTHATCKKVWHKSYTSGHCLRLPSVPCSASRTRFRVSPAGSRVSQSESRDHLGFLVTGPSQPAADRAELDPLLVRAIPFSSPNASAFWPSGAFHYHNPVRPQGHRQALATEPEPEASHSIPKWAAWRCGFDSRGRQRIVHRHCIPQHTRGRLLTEQTAVKL